ncbi:VacJ family lipoprotein [soil metagenome]
MMHIAKRTILPAVILLLSACASTPHNPRDPLEGFNRAMFTFNDSVDQLALKPAAKLYESVLPSFVQSAVGNFFGNIGDVSTALNNFLQGRVTNGLTDVMRVAVNSTLGFGGLIDIGSEVGMTKHREDFGQTLGRWGVQSGPYVVLPFLGSSTVRDTSALPVDFASDLWSYKYPVRWRNAGSVVRVIDQRAAVLDASNLIEEAALDRYEFIRDAYLQRRESKVRDGEATPEPSQEAGSKGKDSSHLNGSDTESNADQSRLDSASEPVAPVAVEIESAVRADLVQEPGQKNSSSRSALTSL